MLAKLEESYLTILRVAVVAVAGLALMVSAAAMIAGAVYLFQDVFSKVTSSASGGSLGEFVAERRASVDLRDVEVRGGSASAEPKEEVALSPAIDDAAATFASYLNKQQRGSAKKADFIARLNRFWLEVEPGREGEYDASLRELSEQVRNSRGRPLSADRVSELLDWHHQRFQQAVEEQRLSTAHARAEAWLWLTRAGQAFLMFVVIAFYFLLVRVERHLRVVTVRQEVEHERLSRSADD